jgi:hypothetical protein
VTHLGRTSFDILGGLVKVLCQATEDILQVGLPRYLGQSPGMVGFVAVMGCAVHKLKTPRCINHSPPSPTPSVLAPMKTEPGPPMTLGDGPKVELRLIAWC